MKTEDRSLRPRYAPLSDSSSQRSLQAAHSQESSFTEATYIRTTS